MLEVVAMVTLVSYLGHPAFQSTTQKQGHGLLEIDD